MSGTPTLDLKKDAPGMLKEVGPLGDEVLRMELKVSIKCFCSAAVHGSLTPLHVNYIWAHYF